MARYLIQRDVSDWSPDDIEAAGLRAKMCIPWFAGLEWVISYHDPARAALLCVYDADSEEDIRAHARFAGLPVTAIWPVMEIHPEDIGRDVAETVTGTPPAAATT